MNTDPQSAAPAALVRLADHVLTCATCRVLDDEGTNLDLPCAARDQLLGEFRAARRAGRSARASG